MAASHELRMSMAGNHDGTMVSAGSKPKSTEVSAGPKPKSTEKAMGEPEN